MHDDGRGDADGDGADDVRRIETCVVDAIARGDAVDASALLFLLRRYQLTARDDLADAVGRALGAALDRSVRDPSIVARAGWLTLFVEASALADDARLHDVMGDLVEALRGGWRSASVEDACASIGACLHAAGLARFTGVAADAIDELERVVAAVYRPGAAIGALADQVSAAFTLLIAYSLCGRLPYAMLAEELIQRARLSAEAEFVPTCEAARVLCRLAALHDDPDYRASASVVPAADYRGDAARLLASQAAEARRRGASGAIYGVALLELESRDSYGH